MDMEIKIGVVESHYYKGVRELQKIDLEKFPLIKQFLEVKLLFVSVRLFVD